MTNLAARTRSEWERIATPLRPEGRAFINGKFVAASDGRVFEKRSPIDGRVIAEVARCAQRDVDDAVAAARAAFEAGTWRRTDPKERKRVLLRFAELIRRDLEHLAMLETLDVGKPISNSVDVDVPKAADTLAYYAEFADKLYDEVAPTGPDDLALIRREPLGVVAAIVPWNYPLIITAWKVGPALLTGNSVVLKPAEQSPLTAIRIGELGASAESGPRGPKRTFLLSGKRTFLFGYHSKTSHNVYYVKLWCRWWPAQRLPRDQTIVLECSVRRISPLMRDLRGREFPKTMACMHSSVLPYLALATRGPGWQAKFAASSTSPTPR